MSSAETASALPFLAASRPDRYGRAQHPAPSMHWQVVRAHLWGHIRWTGANRFANDRRSLQASLGNAKSMAPVLTSPLALFVRLYDP
jgi:hypothetical protein